MCRQFNDRYIQIRDKKGDSRIIYADHGSIYLPRCTTIDTIILHKYNGICHEDIEIEVEITSKKELVFLLLDNILAKSSKIIPKLYKQFLEQSTGKTPQ